MIVRLLTEQHLEFLSLKGGCRGSSESTLVKMSHCWKSHALAHLICDGRMEHSLLQLSEKWPYHSWSVGRMKFDSLGTNLGGVGAY